MTQNRGSCPLCQQEASQESVASYYTITYYSDCGCKGYYLSDMLVATHIQSGACQPNEKDRLSALLAERHWKGLPPPLLIFGDHPLPDVDFATPIHVKELLARWPRSVPETLDRCLCNLAKYKPNPGAEIKLQNGRPLDFLFFTSSRSEERYYIAALEELEWITNPGRHTQGHGIQITPTGWARIGELAGGADRLRNPAFVAMWFGGAERREEMTNLYKKVIEPAINNAGYLAQRSDDPEHNDPIMDRIIEDIRRAPFVVADMSENNNGVYYEAGFARGRDVEVIYCVKEGQKVHFDVTGVNHVRWKNEDDLRSRLESRILATVSQGPHKFPEEPG